MIPNILLLVKMMTDEERRQYNAIYYEKNRDRIAKYKSNKIQCKCGSVVAQASYKRHLRTDIHSNNLKQIAYDSTIINEGKKQAKKKM